MSSWDELLQTEGPLGKPLPRLEDQRLLRGLGRFTDDAPRQDDGIALFLRAPIAHGQVTDLSTEDALEMPDVRAIITAQDIAASGLKRLAYGAKVPNMTDVRRPIMAEDRVRHLGEIVAMVVADNQAAAEDALEAIVVDFDDEAAVTDLAQSQQADAPLLHVSAPGNLAYRWEKGDREATDRAMAEAAQVVSLEVDNPRIIINPMEPRAAWGEYRAEDESFHLVCPTQGTQRLRELMAKEILGIENDQLQIVTQDVGGAFGIRLQAYPELVLVLLAAKITGQPVRWVAARSESFLCDAQGRGQRNKVTLGLDREGHFLALRMESLADLGAYYSTNVATIPTQSGNRVLGIFYKIPVSQSSVQAVFTNLAPTDAYRGAGKPELAHALERVIEKAARLRGEDPVTLRRRNLLSPQDLPFTTGLGETIDSGDLPGAFERLLEICDWQDLAARKTASRARGRLRGFALGTHFHATGGAGKENSRLVIDPQGQAHLYSSSMDGGQGHETAFAQLLAQLLQIPLGQARLHQGNSADLAQGSGTGGSAGVPVSAVNFQRLSALLIEQAKAQAAAELDAPRDEIDYAEGRLLWRGHNRSLGLFELAEVMATRGQALAADLQFDGPHSTYPNGCYAAELEVDPETGQVTLERFCGVDDIGHMLNPLITAGQIHGGIAQSIGQALLEKPIYEAQSGQLLSGSFMDYGLPRADDLPNLSHEFRGIPTKINPLGAKGVGELGNIGAIAPVVNALLDALQPLGVTDIDIPLTPERVWRAIQDAR